MSDCVKKTKISICMGSSCYPRGNDKNLELLKHYLKIHSLEEGVELSGHRCQENCHLGPNLIVDDIPHQEIHPAIFPSFLKQTLPVFSSGEVSSKTDGERHPAPGRSKGKEQADDD